METTKGIYAVCCNQAFVCVFTSAIVVKKQLNFGVHLQYTARMGSDFSSVTQMGCFYNQKKFELTNYMFKHTKQFNDNMHMFNRSIHVGKENFLIKVYDDEKTIIDSSQKFKHEYCKKVKLPRQH